jgi:lipid-A-disaccharide synthase-like uncharacterized protein
MQDTHASGLVTLDYVVQSLKNELKEFTDNNDIHYLQLAIDGFTELNMFHTNMFRVKYLTIDSETNTAVLPDDYLYYSLIGIIRNNSVYTLTRNDTIPLIRGTDCGEDVNNYKNSMFTGTASGSYYIPHYGQNGNWVPSLFSQGGGFNYGHYRLDEERRMIQLQGGLSGESLVLEYASRGVVVGGETYVKYQAVPVIKAYIHWKRVEYDNTVSAGEKERKKRQFYEQTEMYRTIENKFTMEEIRDVFNMTSKQSPKR